MKRFGLRIEKLFFYESEKIKTCEKLREDEDGKEELIKGMKREKEEKENLLTRY